MRALVSAFVFAVLALSVVIFVDGPAPAKAQAQAKKTPQNLKIYSKDTDLKTVRQEMKKISKAVGMKCKSCHKPGDFAADTEKKEVTREMMRMTKSINLKLKKGGFKGKVDCMTCHQGEEHPSK